MNNVNTSPNTWLISVVHSISELRTMDLHLLALIKLPLPNLRLRPQPPGVKAGCHSGQCDGWRIQICQSTAVNC